MINITNKKIKNKKYPYAEYSFRLPNKKIKKISKYIKDKNNIDEKKIKDYFLLKETESFSNYATSKYKTDSVITINTISKIESMKIEFKHLKKRLTDNQLNDIIDRFTVNFTYESNAIEGNSLTLKDVTLILKENISPKNKDLREIYETKNTRIVTELLFNNKLKINLKDILKIHSILMKDTDISLGFKKIPNYLLMRDLKTTPPEKVESEIKKLLSWYNKNKEKIHIIKLISEFHARFERIHPFEDGNGRVGRMLINVILMENKYPPLIIRKRSKTSYFSALEAYDNNFRLKLDRFLLKKFKSTFKKFFGVYVKYL